MTLSFEYLIILILGLYNLFILLKVFLLKLNAFSPISIFSLIIISQFFSQLPVILTNTTYTNYNKFIPVFFILLSQIAFNYGFKKSVKNNYIINYNFDIHKIHILILIFTILGIIALPFYSQIETVYGGINVELGYLRDFGLFSLIIGLSYFQNKKFKYTILLKFCIISSLLTLLYFAYFIKGSRQMMFTLFVVVLFFFIKNKSLKLKKYISICFVIFFIFGSFLSFSMTDIRKYNNYKEEQAVNIFEINYLENFQNSLFQNDITNGMDLGNATILMNYTFENSILDFGTGFWNHFIRNFFPSRYFGQELKNELYLNIHGVNNLEKIEETITNGITTTTGFYDAFKSFSFFGFIVFYWIGYYIGIQYVKSKKSNFNLFIYMICLTIIPNALTHSIQYFLGRLEFIFIFLFPLFYFFKIRISNENHSKSAKRKT